MKQRIMYAINRGIPIAVLIYVVRSLLDMRSKSMSEAFFSPEALNRIFLYVIGAVLGYFFFGWWAQKEKKDK